MMRSSRYILFCLHLMVAVLSAALPMGAQTRMQGDKVHMQVRTEKKINRFGLRSDPYDGVYHFGSFWLEGAYSQFMASQSQAINKGGYGVGGGLSYLYQNGRMLISTGVGVRYQVAYTAVANYTATYPRVRDTQGTEYDLNLLFEDRTDLARSLYINVPLMAGAYFYRRWYVMAGFKFEAQLIGSTSMSALATSVAYYDRYIGPIGEMDNHGLRRQVPLTREGDKLNLGLDVLASLELGHEWKMKKGTRYIRGDIDRRDYRVRLALFADVGILSVMPSHTANPLYGVPADTRYDFDTFTMTHLFASDQASGALRNIFAGVKLSFHFGYKTRQKCIMCSSRGRQQYLKNYN